MLGLFSLLLNLLLMTWRYILSAVIGGLAIMAISIAQQTALSDDPQPVETLVSQLLLSVLYTSVLMAILAAPLCLGLILLGRVTSVRSRIYYMVIGGFSGFSALWVMANLLDTRHISLDPSSPQVIASIAGGIIAGFFYRMIAIK